MSTLSRLLARSEDRLNVGDAGKVVWVVKCAHTYHESCVCKLVGHKVVLGAYVPSMGRYRIRGGWKQLGGPCDDYIISKDQSPRPSLLARLISGKSAREWDQFADEEERSAFLRAQSSHVMHQPEPLGPGRSYSFTDATETDIRRASVIHQEQKPSSPFAQ